MMIIIHNYLHFQSGFFIENESVFKPTNVKDFTNYIFPLKWYESFSGLAAFLGHYGVQLFIFLSAYGLAIQLYKSNAIFSYKNYLLKRLKKLYFLLAFGVIIFLCIYFVSNSSFYSIKKTLVEFFMIITSYSNFRKSTLYSNFSGPFWFFGLMVQLYIFFPILYTVVKKYNFCVIIGITYLVIIALYFIDRKSDFSVFGNLIGHLPEVLLGIYFAQNGIKRTSFWVFVLSVILFCLSQIYGTLFPFGFLAITIVLLTLFSWVRVIINDFFLSGLVYIGNISMILFVTNGPFRFLPFFNGISNELRAERVFLYLILLFLVSHVLFLIYKKIVKVLKI